MVATAFDSYGFEFDPDQYALITFQLEIGKGLKAEHVTRSRGTFLVSGVQLGNYDITAYVEKFQRGQSWLSAKRVASLNYNKIEVFPVLDLYPKTLLLTPDMKYTLGVLGGPSRGYDENVRGTHVEIKFDTEDRDVATIDSFREVHAHAVGDTRLYYNIMHTKRANDGKETRSIVS